MVLAIANLLKNRNLGILHFDVRNVGSNASVALDILREFHPDVVVSDIAMPDTDGNQLVQEITRLYPDRQIVAIALSAYAGITHRQQSLQAGFQLHLTKPIEPDALIAEIVNLIQK